MDEIKRFVGQRYSFWSSTMRAELCELIKEAERQVETKHFAQWQKEEQDG